jgi:O-antigen/teichoic acid export membrane protein
MQRRLKTTSPYRKAISHTAIYSVANIIRKTVGFLMLPIYTRYLTPEDYGAVQLMMMVVAFMEVFVAMRMGAAIFRYYSLAKDSNEKKTVMSTAFLMVMCTSTVAFLILLTNASSATEIFLGDTRYADMMSIIAILLVLQALEDYGLIYLRVQQRAVLFLFLSVFKLIVSVSLNVYFIIFLEMTVAGIVYSACISTGLMAIFSTFYTFYYSGFSFSRHLLKKLVVFSYPLWIAAVGSVYSSSSVNYYLRVFSSMDDVGIYMLAIKFATLITVIVWIPFSNIWHSLRYDVYDMPEPNKVFQTIFIGIVFVLSVAGLGLSLFSDTLIHLMADEAFWSAGGVVPILIMGIIVMALTDFNNFGILVNEKTGIIAVGTYLNAIVATVGFFIFIPIIGLYGAAFVTLFGAIIQLFWIEWKSKKLYDMQLPWRRVSMMSVTWLICYSFSLLLPESLLISIVGRSLIFICFLWLMYVLPILKKNEKDQILVYFRLYIAKARNYLTSGKT